MKETSKILKINTDVAFTLNINQNKYIHDTSGITDKCWKVSSVKYSDW